MQIGIGKALTGESVYSPEDLTQAIQAVKSKVFESVGHFAKLKDEETRKKQRLDMTAPAYKEFKF